MTSIDRNYMLEELSRDKNIQDERSHAFAHQNNALTMVAVDRAYTLGLLIAAIEDGLLEKLHGQRSQAELDGMVWP